MTGPSVPPDLVVSADGAARWRGRTLRCALGRGGIRTDKREGDGATPAGRWRLVRALWRPDRGAAPETALPVAPVGRDDGWCDDPASADYNRPVRLPHPASCERMWRDDGLYDLVVVTDHNASPPVAGAGSAIFVHVARPDWGPTEGCVAFPETDLRAILKEWTETDRLVVTAA
jgi:L,D-peptidoglycan transpeptidase YkuD (ErfK/YbiS/YcfS/YnhG family)